MPTRRVVSRDLRSVTLASEALDYLLVRRHGRRGVGFKVDENGLTVNAPASMPLSRIETLVRESERWVLRKVAEWRLRRVPPPSWSDGSMLPFLGESLTLRLGRGPRRHVLRSGCELVVILREPEGERVRRAVVDWYRQAAKRYFEGRVADLAQAAGLAPPILLVSSARSRWGSCNTRREVRLSWRLVKAPPALVDYVICHELAHLRHMDHSAAFWMEVERMCPEYRQLRSRLLESDAACRTF